MAVDLIGMEREKKKLFYKLIAFVLVLTVIFGGIMIFVFYKAFTEEGVFLERFNCQYATNSTYELNRTQDFNDIGKQIEMTYNYEAGSMKYLTLDNVEQCDNSLGFWFEQKEGDKKYVYCLKSGNVLELFPEKCKKSGTFEGLIRSWGIIKDNPLRD